MDSIKREKLRAMRNYKKNQFLQNLFQYSLTAYVLGLCLCKSFPSLCSSLELFIFVSLPNIAAFIVGPKCLFLVCNMIVIFLVKESNLLGSSSSSPTSDIYDEYVKHSRSLRSPPTIQEKEKERKLDVSLAEENVEIIKVVEEDVKQKEEEEEEAKEGEGEGEGEEEEEEKEEEKGGMALDGGEGEEEEEEKEEEKGGMALDGEEQFELPADELNKRVEDFIARVNKRRMLEAKMLVCGG